MVREELAKYLNSAPCPECEGTRLRLEARHVRVDGHTIYGLNRMPLKQAQETIAGLQLSGAKLAIADKIVREIVNRLQFLNNVGLDYLALDRSAETLSGGEAQRIRLASQIGSGLDRRHVRARRTVYRSASARQCAIALHSRTAARSG